MRHLEIDREEFVEVTGRRVWIVIATLVAFAIADVAAVVLMLMRM